MIHLFPSNMQNQNPTCLKVKLIWIWNFWKKLDPLQVRFKPASSLPNSSIELWKFRLDRARALPLFTSSVGSVPPLRKIRIGTKEVGKTLSSLTLSSPSLESQARTWSSLDNYALELCRVQTFNGNVSKKYGFGLLLIQKANLSFWKLGSIELRLGPSSRCEMIINQ